MFTEKGRTEKKDNQKRQREEEEETGMYELSQQWVEILK